MKKSKIKKRIRKKKNSRKKKQLGDISSPSIVLGIFVIESLQSVDIAKFKRDTKIIAKSNPKSYKDRVSLIIIETVQKLIDRSSHETKLKMKDSKILLELTNQIEILNKKETIIGHNYNKLLLACYINLLILVKYEEINTDYELWLGMFKKMGEIDNVESKSFYNTYFSLNA